MVRYIYNIRYAPAAPESSSWAHPKSACRVVSHTFHLGQHSIQNGTPLWHQGAWRAGRHQPEHPFDGVLQTPPAAGAADAAGAAKACGFTERVLPPATFFCLGFLTAAAQRPGRRGKLRPGWSGRSGARGLQRGATGLRLTLSLKVSDVGRAAMLLLLMLC